MVDNSSKLKTEIERLKHEKNAVILAHYYTLPEVQEAMLITGKSRCPGNVFLSVRNRLFSTFVRNLVYLSHCRLFP